MTVHIHHMNAKNSLELTPESDIERLVIQQMLADAGKGQSVTLTPASIDSATLAVNR